jgi:AraC-like DNA-binding protein
MASDALSDVLRTVRLTGATFFDVVARNPWCAEQPTREMVLPKVLPGAEHLISYHLVTEGSCFAGIVGQEQFAVEAGEVIVFTRGDPHVVSSHPGMRAQPVTPEEVAFATAGPLPFFRSIGEEGPASVKLTCGFLACDSAPFNPLLEHLPPVIKSGKAEGDDAPWLGQFIQLAIMESKNKRAGGEGVLAKLSELMFIEVVRCYIQTLSAEETGWLAGLADKHMAAALNAMHGKPSQAWTLEDLAKLAGLSRSAFAERFTQVLGQPPIQYLTEWRMQLANGILANTKDSIAQVASQVGYESEAAFSRAFKKMIGSPPAEWRRNHLAQIVPKERN